MGGRQPARTPSAFVFAPSPLLTVTIEAVGEGAEIHLHAGGQGVWITRMIAALGLPVSLCGTFGGESGSVIAPLIEREGIALRRIESGGANGAYVHDRRSGERRSVAEMPAGPLSRHEVDELYGVALVGGLEADVCVLGGPAGPDVLPADTYRRLAADLADNGRTVVADLSGEPLRAALDGGLALLKVSHEELIDDGWANGARASDLVAAMEALVEAGARNVLVSRAEEPALALFEGRLLTVSTPLLHTVDRRGAGDSMTAGLVVGLARGRGLEDAARLGAAAGSLNVTRHGLATGSRDEIERLASLIDVAPLELDGSPTP